MPTVVVIGAGASGCFCSIRLKDLHPEADVLLLEKESKPLCKVARTGGGRCNLTNTFEDGLSLGDIYPRGANLMKRALSVFSQQDTVKWFTGAGVRLKVEDGGRVFPVSDSALQVVHCLESRMRQKGVALMLNTDVGDISLNRDGTFCVKTNKGMFHADKVVVCSGGGALSALSNLPVRLEECVPSLFALKIDSEGLGELAGISCRNCTLSLPSAGIKANGDVLVTPWGLTGPGILRLSSYGARHLSKTNYSGTLVVSWAGLSQAEALGFIQEEGNSPRLVANCHPDGIADRLWKYLLVKAGIRPDLRWAEMGTKGRARLASVISADSFAIVGRRSSKEEFVTCGGVSLKDVKSSNLESRSIAGMHFAGEALDIDAITGGYNLQAAWSTAAVVAENLL